MKPFFLFFLSISFLVVACGTIDSSADFVFEEIENGLIVVGYTGNDTSVVIPESINGKPVIEIARDAFYNNIIVESIRFPESIIRIQHYSFANCFALESVNIPEKITIIESNVFEDCINLKSIQLPNNLKEIYSDAFSGCMKLEKVVFPDSLEKIGSSAFENCLSLDEIFIPKNVAQIHTGAFKKTPLVNIFVDEENSNYYSSDGILFHHNNILVQYPIGREDKSYVIPPEIIGIWGGAFFNSKIESFQVDINNQKFISIDGLVYLKSDNTHLYLYPSGRRDTSITVPSFVKSIAQYAFAGSINLTSVTIQEGVEELEGFTFEGCASITDVTLPISLESIGLGTFKNCISLEKIEIPRNVTNLNQLFIHCLSLKEVSILGNVLTISDLTFLDCIKLEIITLPSSVELIESDAFANCYNIRSITINAHIPPQISSYLFRDIIDEIEIYVPEESIEQYKSAEIWSTYRDSIYSIPEK